jgi:hypothetical protein
MFKQTILDKAAIAISVLCLVHCLLLPALMVTFPLASAFDGEALHGWLLLAILPTSLGALILGCRRHNNKIIYFLCGLGLIFLLGGFLFGHDFLGEAGEKIFTIIGGVILAIGHFYNYSLCRKTNCCEKAGCEAVS